MQLYQAQFQGSIELYFVSPYVQCLSLSGNHVSDYMGNETRAFFLSVALINLLSI